MVLAIVRLASLTGHLNHSRAIVVRIMVLVGTSQLRLFVQALGRITTEAAEVVVARPTGLQQAQQPSRPKVPRSRALLPSLAPLPRLETAREAGRVPIPPPQVHLALAPLTMAIPTRKLL